MRVYMFRAALLCEECGKSAMWRCAEAGQTDIGDSDDYPQGPYSNGGGEADCPQHCDTCHVFLQNPLTHDGYAYVQACLDEGTGSPEVLREWAIRYGFNHAPIRKG